MKRSIIRMAIMAVLLAVSGTASAQSLGDVLGKVAKAATGGQGNSAAMQGLTTIFNAAKTAKASDLVGTWKYEEPAIVFSSNNLLKQAGGKVVSSTLEKKLQSKLAKYGIKKGMMTMTFTSDGKFTQTVGKKKLSGTYTVSGKNVVLKYGGTTKQMIGTTQVSGRDLLIVMNATKLLSYVKTLGSLAGDATLKTATSLLGSMDGMQCGLRLVKK